MQALNSPKIKYKESHICPCANDVVYALGLRNLELFRLFHGVLLRISILNRYSKFVDYIVVANTEIKLEMSIAWLNIPISQTSAFCNVSQFGTFL